MEDQGIGPHPREKLTDEQNDTCYGKVLDATGTLGRLQGTATLDVEDEEVDSEKKAACDYSNAACHQQSASPQVIHQNNGGQSG